MLKALEGIWNKVRTEGNGIDVNLPLIGNGLSRIGLPPSQLLQLTFICPAFKVRCNAMALALGRKNYLFCGNHEAALRTAIIYSLMGTCIANNVNSAGVR